ncbi:hypothetical protein COM90_22475 [Bacillus thuringiensis]|uniref:Uncharacterized protein n=1 Tax=Bacillus thuringiensis TaxID=1428 RepID=A0AB36TTW5_BACTU|nr:hypothetical protein COM74_04375 [Bacillus thuringiensis]PEE86579.1 hypothetical protein COM90_22475 [Bacillus thuringiensis]PFM88087.1 hypothetical protein COJ61_22315 [Bacillus thuringiensis]
MHVRQLIMHGQFPKKYTAKYNILENKIKIRSECLCILRIVIKSLIPMPNVWRIAHLDLQVLNMNVGLYVGSIKQDLGIYNVQDLQHIHLMA